MDFTMYQNRLSQLSARFHLMVLLVFGLLISNVLLSVFVWTSRNSHTVEITPFFANASYIKSASSVDSHYLSLMTENFINERLNISPETVDANHKRLLSFVSQGQYAHFLKLLTSEAQVIKNKKMSSSFDITEIKANPNDLHAEVRGILKRYVGIQAIAEVQKTYELAFQYQRGRLSIVQFTPKKENAHA